MEPMKKPEGPDPSNPPRWFYASVMDESGRKKALLAGPYGSHDEALAAVPKARAKAEAADPRAVFYAFGTAGSDEEFKTLFGAL